MKRTLLVGASCCHRQQCWLLLLQLASPPGRSRLPGTGLPASRTRVRSMCDGPSHLRCAGPGRAVHAAAAMVMGEPVECRRRTSNKASASAFACNGAFFLRKRWRTGRVTRHFNTPTRKEKIR